MTFISYQQSFFPITWSFFYTNNCCFHFTWSIFHNRISVSYGPYFTTEYFNFMAHISQQNISISWSIFHKIFQFHGPYFTTEYFKFMVHISQQDISISWSIFHNRIFQVHGPYFTTGYFNFMVHISQQNISISWSIFHTNNCTYNRGNNSQIYNTTSAMTSAPLLVAPVPVLCTLTAICASRVGLAKQHRINRELRNRIDKFLFNLLHSFQ